VIISAQIVGKTKSIREGKIVWTSKIFGEPIHNAWGAFLAEGIVLVIFGMIAVLLPTMAGLAVTILLGWLLVVSGVLGIVTTLINRHLVGFWSLASATVTIVVGAMLFAWPLGGLISLSFALGGFLALDGLFAIAMAFDHRRHFTAKWIWLLVNGFFDLAFAAIIFLWLPQSAAWAFGFIIGADMLIGGTTLIAMALDLRKN
jgi:uncharacterized membrane protein HdeD (DUF308 family)